MRPLPSPKLLPNISIALLPNTLKSKFTKGFFPVAAPSATKSHAFATTGHQSKARHSLSFRQKITLRSNHYLLSKGYFLPNLGKYLYPNLKPYSNESLSRIFLSTTAGTSPNPLGEGQLPIKLL